jgi:hypothetical protein
MGEIIPSEAQKSGGPERVKLLLEIAELALKLGLGVLGYLELPAGSSLLRHNLIWTVLAVFLAIYYVRDRYQEAKHANRESLVSRKEPLVWIAIGFVLYGGLYLALNAFDQNPVESTVVNALINILIVLLWATTFGAVAYSCSLQVASFIYSRG